MSECVGVDHDRVTGVLQDRTVLITGGTGSFGRQMLLRLAQFEPRRILVFSRDEKKQMDMSYEFSNPNIEFVVGDVRDANRVDEVMRGVDIVYHAAALKQVPHCEKHPLEAVKTNVLGAVNVRAAAIRNGVQRVVAISTDKAVKPVNAMGMTKALQERVMLEGSSSAKGPRFNVVRYGNVLGSRGSVVPFFCRLLRESKPLPITHPEMTRFLLTLDEAVDLVLRATISGGENQLFIRKSAASRVTDLARAVARLLTHDANYSLKFVGVRPGEKIHETLVSEDEMRRATEEDNYFIIDPVGRGRPGDEFPHLEYSSSTTRLLDVDEISQVLLSSGVLRKHHAVEEA